MSSTDSIPCQSGLWGRCARGSEGTTQLIGDPILQTLGCMQQLLADGYVSVRVGGCHGVMCTQVFQEARGPGGRQEWSEHAKALAALTDGQLQHPVHLFIRVICGEAQLVKTCVCSRERAVGRSGNNLE